MGVLAELSMYVSAHCVDGAEIVQIKLFPLDHQLELMFDEQNQLHRE
ncbi:hypothetical protein [Xanthomonas pisi]|nr:hypothetical protein [Xanthomonas pisi]